MLKIKGVITDLSVESDEYGGDYIRGTIDVPRISGVKDTIYFRAEYSHDMYLHFKDSMNSGTLYILSGSLRTYETGGTLPRYRTCLYVRDYSVAIDDTDLNEFNGWLTIHRVGELRVTPSGTTILDVVVFSERTSGMKDKIPMICFNKTAEFAAHFLEKGQRVKVVGRFQSRNYDKSVNETQVAIVTINELAASYITVPGGKVVE